MGYWKERCEDKSGFVGCFCTAIQYKNPVLSIQYYRLALKSSTKIHFCHFSTIGSLKKQYKNTVLPIQYYGLALKSSTRIHFCHFSTISSLKKQYKNPVLPIQYYQQPEKVVLKSAFLIFVLYPKKSSNSSLQGEASC